MPRFRIEKPFERGLPQVCPGCGRDVQTFYSAVLRKTNMSLPEKILGLLGHGAHWTRYTLKVPACRSCAGKANMGPWVAAGCGAALFLGGIFLVGAGGSNPQQADLFRKMGGLCILIGMFATPIAYFVLKETLAPFKMHSFGPTPEKIDWIEVTVRYPGYLRELDRR